MNKELQDLAWSVLPKEFKEEVKKRYNLAMRHRDLYSARGAIEALELLFGRHNLTSDAEGEDDETLYVSRKKLQYFYENLRRVGENHAAFALQSLFGSKCLPDEEKFSVGDIVVFHPFKTNSFYDAKLIEIKEGEDKPYLLQLGNKEEIWAYPIEVQSIAETYPKEPKPAEPKFKKGDIAYYACSPTVKHKCAVTKVMQNEHSGKWEYNVMFEWGKPGMWIPESDLEPYTGPKNEYSERIHAESVQESRIASEESHLRNLSQSMSNCDKHFDTILKDSFSKERRLNIAASIAAGWLACHGMTTPETIAMDALAVADALIIEVKKQITPKNEQI